MKCSTFQALLIAALTATSSLTTNLAHSAEASAADLAFCASSALEAGANSPEAVQAHCAQQLDELYGPRSSADDEQMRAMIERQWTHWFQNSSADAHHN